MLMYSDQIKTEAIDGFDNFIIQAIAPNADEIKAIQVHNRSDESHQHSSANSIHFSIPTAKSFTSSTSRSSASTITF